MNRGGLQSSLVQQIMGGSPSWWKMNNLNITTEQPTSTLQSSSSSSPSSSSSSSIFPHQLYPQPSHPLPMVTWHDQIQDLPESWSQLLMEGLVGEEQKYNSLTPFQAKKMENWEETMGYNNIKQKGSERGYAYAHGSDESTLSRSSWSQIIPSATSSNPRSTLINCNMLDFSNTKAEIKSNHQSDPNSFECNSIASGSAFKKARIQGPSSTQSTFKVRKEKLGDRITALHQIVSPFGKTDTASVLLEAIGYIRFLQGQIGALSSPYLGSGSDNTRLPAHGDQRSCIFPEDPGQLLNDASMKKRGATDHHQEADNVPSMDLRSRGLCLVPVSCTMHVDRDNGADYWAPATLGGGFN